MSSRLVTPDATTTMNPDGTLHSCPQCDAAVVQVQGLLACHDCDWTRGGR